jgi:hypothetical protein
MDHMEASTTSIASIGRSSNPDVRREARPLETDNA